MLAFVQQQQIISVNVFFSMQIVVSSTRLRVDPIIWFYYWERVFHLSTILVGLSVAMNNQVVCCPAALASWFHLIKHGAHNKTAARWTTSSTMLLKWTAAVGTFTHDCSRIRMKQQQQCSSSATGFNAGRSGSRMSSIWCARGWHFNLALLQPGTNYLRVNDIRTNERTKGNGNGGRSVARSVGVMLEGF